MQIKFASMFVNDQEKALKFYTETLGFLKKADIPLGEYRWLTVVSPEDPDGTELVLEPDTSPIAKTFQHDLFEAGIPATALAVTDIASEYDRLTKLGVTFKSEPNNIGPAIITMLDDTCGNWIQLAQATV